MKCDGIEKKYHKATNDNDKNIIKKEINELTKNIDIIHAQRNDCDRIINRYYVIREEYEKKSKKEDKVQELTKIDKKKSLKIR